MHEPHVDVWWLDTTRYGGDEWLLNEAEIKRANAFHFPIHRQRFVARRCALRVLLGRTIGAAPEYIAYRTGEFGKLYLQSPKTDVQFNLSDSGDITLIAISRGVEVGVDIEEIKALSDLRDVASTWMTDRELAAYSAVSDADSVRVFFQWWAAKEAVIKATGEGLQSAKRVDLRLGEDNRMHYASGDRVLALRQIDLFDHSMVYLCAQSSDLSYEVREFTA